MIKTTRVRLLDVFLLVSVFALLFAEISGRKSLEEQLGAQTREVRTQLQATTLEIAKSHVSRDLAELANREKYGYLVMLRDNEVSRQSGQVTFLMTWDIAVPDGVSQLKAQSEILRCLTPFFELQRIESTGGSRYWAVDYQILPTGASKRDWTVSVVGNREGFKKG